jgi:D-alanyl-D-alanine carboxypeptidase
MPSRVTEAESAAYLRSLWAYRLLLSSLWVCCFMAFPIGDAAIAGSRHAAMAIDGNTGETLHAESADELRHPASLTKMMTIYMVFEQLEAGRLTPSTKLKVSQEAASAAPTKLDLEPGEQIAVIDAVKALITKSANDMAIVLAEAIGGTEAKFAELMTQKARSLGMRNTTFRNASGLPDSGQVTTARDMLTLALRLQDDFPKLYPLFATRTFSYNGATHKNHNTLLGTFEGIDGIKTGYTRMSGFNVVTSLRRGEKHIVAAVFGGATAGTRNATMRLVLTRSLLKASTKKTRNLRPC